MTEAYKALVNMIFDRRVNEDPDAYGWKLAFQGKREELMLCHLDWIEVIKLILVIDSSRSNASDESV